MPSSLKYREAQMPKQRGNKHKTALGSDRRRSRANGGFYWAAMAESGTKSTVVAQRSRLWQESKTVEHQQFLMTPLRVSRRLIFMLPLVAFGGSHARPGPPSDFHRFSPGPPDAAGRGSGIDHRAALQNGQFLSRVIELDPSSQRTMTFGEYLDKVVTPQRLDGARRQLATIGAARRSVAALQRWSRAMLLRCGGSERFRQLMGIIRCLVARHTRL